MIPSKAQGEHGKRQAEAAMNRKPRGVQLFGGGRPGEEDPALTAKMAQIRTLNAHLMDAVKEYDKQHPLGY